MPAATYVDLTTFDPAHMPRVRGEVTMTLADYKEYKTFFCYGCQSCWYMDEEQNGEGAMGEHYPHLLSPLILARP